MEKENTLNELNCVVSLLDCWSKCSIIVYLSFFLFVLFILFLLFILFFTAMLCILIRLFSFFYRHRRRTNKRKEIKLIAERWSRSREMERERDREKEGSSVLFSNHLRNRYLAYYRDWPDRYLRILLTIHLARTRWYVEDECFCERNVFVSGSITAHILIHNN